MSEKILSKCFEIPNYRFIDVFMQHGGYVAAKRVLESLMPEHIMNELKRSNLRGLGGAGFPTGMKWSFIPKDSDKPKYVVVNADEGEPGTFKDRYILALAPHALIEGIIIACFAISSHKSYVYIRGEYDEPAKRLSIAIQEAYDKGFLGKNIFGSKYALDIVIHRGAGAYICGEETALIESIEGKKGQPRLKPPFPAIVGLFNCPTVINNVETLSYVPYIIKNGGDWFSKLGCERNGGLRLFSVSGHVKKPGLYELPMGTLLKSIIYEHAGGIRSDRSIKAVIPGGISAPVLSPNELDVAMDYDSIKNVQSMLGSGGIIVMDDTTCMVKALEVATRFFAEESCGQCSPCREGTGWIHRIVKRIVDGNGLREDLDNLIDIAKNMMGNTICAFGDAAPSPVISYITKYRDEFEQYIHEKKYELVAHL